MDYQLGGGGARINNEVAGSNRERHNSIVE